MIASTFACGLLALASTVQGTVHRSYLNYSVVPGLFLQDDPATNPSTFNFTATNFGLINRKYPSDSSYGRDFKHSTQWQRLAHYIEYINKKAKRTERYALLFLGRHGEGYHNAAESFFGTPAWNCYWSELDGNGTVTWADADVTPKGVDQAKAVRKFWEHLIKDEKITPPESFYTSPMSRCLETAKITFEGLKLPNHKRAVIVVKEFFREGISAHTCDRRRTRSWIHKTYPSFKIEKGFAENDPYWKPLLKETPKSQDVRSKKVLDDVFTNDDSTFISVTSHSGEIASLLRVLNHRVFSLSTGAAMPVLVKITTIKGNAPATPTEPPIPEKTCAAPPTIRDPSCNDCSCCL